MSIRGIVSIARSLGGFCVFISVLTATAWSQTPVRKAKSDSSKFYGMLSRMTLPSYVPRPIAHEGDTDPYPSWSDAGPSPVLESLSVAFAPILHKAGGGTGPIDVPYMIFRGQDGNVVDSAALFCAGFDDRGRNTTAGSVRIPYPTGTHGDFGVFSALVGQTPRIVSCTGKPNHRGETVLYFDFPGKDPKSWKKAEALYFANGVASRLYVHPFVYRHDFRDDEPRNELVLQYWFFYPYNDAVNDHEGDWEHVNVSLTTKERVRSTHDFAQDRLLTDSEVAAILRGAVNQDEIAISAVDYYFHNFVLTADYIAGYYLAEHPGPKPPGLLGMIFGGGHRDSLVIADSSGLLSRFGWGRDRNGKFSIARVIKLMNRDAGFHDFPRHPLGFIGGANRSVLHYLAGGAGRNNDSHGTYPFPGRYSGLESDAVELVEGNYGTHSRDSTGGEGWLRFEPGEIQLLPDIESLLPSLKSKDSSTTALLGRWGWFVLPVRFGFPVTSSPGATVLEDVDIGQLAPFGPAYNPGWNSVGENRGFRRYQLWLVAVDPEPFICPAPKFPCAALAVATSIPPLITLKHLADRYLVQTRFAPTTNDGKYMGTDLGLTFALGGMDKYARLLMEPSLASASLQSFDTLRSSFRRPVFQPSGSIWPKFYLGIHSRMGNDFSLYTMISALPKGSLSYTLVNNHGDKSGVVTGTITGFMVSSGATLWLKNFENFSLGASMGFGWNFYDVRTQGVRTADSASIVNVSHTQAYNSPVPNNLHWTGRLRWNPYGLTAGYYELALTIESARGIGRFVRIFLGATI